MTAIAHDQLRSIVDRIERLEEEKATIAVDIKEVYSEAKANGYDTKTLRAVVRIRKQDAFERAEQEALLDRYMSTLGMLADTPLGDASIRRAFGDDDDRDLRPRFERKAKAAEAHAPGPEEAAALADIERDGIAAASGATAH